MSDELRGLDPAAVAIKYLISLSSESFDALIDVLDDSCVYTSQKDLRNAITEAVPSLGKEGGRAVAGLGLAFADAELDEKALEGINRRMADRASQELKLEGHDADLAAERLHRLRLSPAFGLVSRAMSAIRRNGSLMLRAAIQTDLRPVVVPQDGVPQLYAVLHRLQIVSVDGLAESDDEAVTEFTLDHEDLRSLIKRAQDALDAQVALQKMLAEGGSSVYAPHMPGGDEGGA